MIGAGSELAANAAAPQDVTHDRVYDAAREATDVIGGALARCCARNYVARRDMRSPYATPWCGYYPLNPPLLRCGTAHHNKAWRGA